MSVPVYKVLLVGDPNVGKSSIIRHLTIGEFDETYHATAGVDLSAVAVNVDPITPVILTVIDLGGQSDFGDLRTQYYRGAHYCILVYDISKKLTFESLPNWHSGIIENIGPISSTKGSLPGILVGNKSDLEDSRQVTSMDARIYADIIGWQFYETSAKTGQNIESIFNQISKELYARYPPLNR